MTIIIIVRILRIKGSIIIVKTLLKLFIASKILTKQNSLSLSPINYIQEILLPKTAIRLILEDISCSTLKTAQKIMIESSDFSYY